MRVCLLILFIICNSFIYAQDNNDKANSQKPSLYQQTIIYEDNLPLSTGKDKGVIKGTSSRLFQIQTSIDTIEFIKLDSSVKFRKPIFIMLQGSLPIPLIIRDSIDKNKYNTFYTSFAFDVNQISKTHHIINISMPHIPVVVTGQEINGNGTYINPSPLYNKNNYLGNYVRRAQEVITYLQSQSWADTSETVIFGHSQGSYIGIKVAAANPDVTALAISGCNPFGRYDGHIRRIRIAELSNQLSSLEAQEQITEHYDRWKHYSDNRNDDSQERGDTYKATFSFSESFVDDLIDIDVPIQVLYGSRDIGAIGCDYLPIAFEAVGKKNYQMSVFPGLGHNFEEMDKHGNSNYEKMHWQKAIDSFYDWVIMQAELKIKRD